MNTVCYVIIPEKVDPQGETLAEQVPLRPVIISYELYADVWSPMFFILSYLWLMRLRCIVKM